MRDNTWFVPRGTDELKSPYKLHPYSRPIAPAECFTVSMVSAVVAEDLDGWLRGKNDVLILTRSSLGEQPLVERIHFYAEELRKGHPIKNMFADTVFLSDDYNGNDRLWLELDVVEVDTDTGERKAATQAFQSLAATAGAVFPAVIPYAFGAKAVTSVVEKLISAFERDKHVVKVPFALYPGDPRPGKAVLQEGSYVAFAHPRNPKKYKLRPNGLLTTGNKPSATSYAVFDISPVKQASAQYVMNQKVATLLTQLQKGNSGSALASIDFLNDTLTQYSNFRKLERYMALKEKASLTKEEKALMARIKKIDVLKPFLPNG